MRELDQFVYNTVCDHFGIDIKIKSRKQNYIEGRRIYFKVLKEIDPLRSLSSLGNSLITIKFDHATVLHHLKQINNFLTYERELCKSYLNILETCKIFESSIRKIYLPNRFMKENPFDKYLSKEDKMQEAVMRYIAIKYPNSFAVHIPNEGKRTMFEQFKLKKMGVMAGMPDVMIFDPKGIYSGLAIELKAGYNKPTENQFKCLRELENRKWRVLWSNSLDKIFEEIDNYMKNV